MANVTIPLLFRDVTGGARRAEVSGTTVAEIVASLDKLHPGIAARLCEGQRLAPIVTVTVDGKIAGKGLATPVQPASEVCLLPSFGGG